MRLFSYPAAKSWSRNNPSSEERRNPNALSHVPNAVCGLPSVVKRLCVLFATAFSRHRNSDACIAIKFVICGRKRPLTALSKPDSIVLPIDADFDSFWEEERLSRRTLQ